MARVELRNVHKVYPGEVHAVSDANITVEDREFVVLVGPSGCGKSTLLRMVAGLETVSSGEIRIGERVVNDVPPKDRDIAMVFQSYALYPHMNVFENMALALKLRKLPKPDIDQRVREAARVLGIESLLERRPRQLSGGERQRVAVGRAIVRKPQVFLFDEPLSNLDAKKRVQTRAELSELHRRLQTTVLYVTHDQVEAMTMGERIVVMRDGVVQQIGPPLEVYLQPANRFVAEFIGSPPMNLVRAELVRGEPAQLRTANGAVLQLDPGHGLALRSAVDLGIRPENVVLGTRPPHWARAARIQGRVEFIERLGSDCLVHVRLDPATIWIVAAEHSTNAAVGADVELWLDLARMHFFDCQTGTPQALDTERADSAKSSKSPRP